MINRQRVTLNDGFWRWLVRLLSAWLLVLVVLYGAQWGWLLFVGNRLTNDQMIFADFARMIARGHTPFDAMYDIKPPVMHVLLAGFVFVLGNTITAIRVATLVLWATVTLLVGLVVWRFTASRPAGWGGGLGALVYASYLTHLEGFETVGVMTMFTLAAVLVLLVGRGRRSWHLLAGVLLALAFFSKPVMAFEGFALVALAAWLAPAGRRMWAAAWVIGGGLIGVGAIAAWAWAAGVLPSLWYHAFYNGLLYTFEPQGSGWHTSPSLWANVQVNFLPDTLPFLLPLLVMGGMAVAVLARAPQQRALLYWCLLWVATAFAGALVGRSLRRSYFVEVVPPLLVLAACAVPLYRHWPTPLQLLPLLLVLALLHSGVLRNMPDLIVRHLAGVPPRSPEAMPQVLAARPTIDALASALRPDQCVWQWDEFGLITYLADRMPCQSAFASQPLMVSASFDVDGLRAEYLNEIVAARPILHSRNDNWGYFPQLQHMVNRYVGERIHDGATVDLYAVDFSSWRDTDHTYGGALQLIGYDLFDGQTACAAHPYRVALTWRWLQPTGADWQVFVQLLSLDQSTRAAGIDAAPIQDMPTSQWRVRNMLYFSDTYSLSAAPGEYVLVAGMYTLDDLARVPVTNAGGERMAGDYAMLDRVTLTETCVG